MVKRLASTGLVGVVLLDLFQLPRVREVPVHILFDEETAATYCTYTPACSALQRHQDAVIAEANKHWQSMSGRNERFVIASRKFLVSSDAKTDGVYFIRLAAQENPSRAPTDLQAYFLGQAIHAYGTPSLHANSERLIAGLAIPGKSTMLLRTFQKNPVTSEALLFLHEFSHTLGADHTTDPKYSKSLLALGESAKYTFVLDPVAKQIVHNATYARGRPYAFTEEKERFPSLFPELQEIILHNQLPNNPDYVNAKKRLFDKTPESQKNALRAFLATR